MYFVTRYVFTIIRLHRSTAYVDAAHSYRPSSVVCLSVCHSSEPCKNGSTDQDAVSVEDSGGRREPSIRQGSRSPMGRGNFEGGKGRPIVKYRETAIICAKTAKLIQMPFGLWAWMSRRNHVLDGGPAVLRDGAKATSFGTQFAITSFVGYNFGCMIASNMLFDSRGGFLGSSYPMKT